MNETKKWEVICEVLDKLNGSIENLAQNNKYVPELMETVKDLTKAQQGLERQLNFIAKKMVDIEKHLDKNAYRSSLGY